MTRAIRAITVERGYDPRRFGLVAFGGAGPMHACALAEALGIERAIVPRPCGVLSAYGLLTAAESYDSARTVRAVLGNADRNGIEATYTDLEDEVLDLTADPGTAETERTAELRYAGQAFELSVECDSPVEFGNLTERFETAHESAYGYRMDEPVELVTLRASAICERDPVSISHAGVGGVEPGYREAFFDGEFVEVPVFDRDRLPVGKRVSGPAVCEQAESTTVIRPDWVGTVIEDGTLVLEHDDRANETESGANR